MQPRRPRPAHLARLVAWQRGDLALAEAHWRATLLRNPNDPLAPRALSDIAHQTGRYEEAARLLRSFAERPPEYSNLGTSLEALGQHDEAEAAYRKAIDLDPNFATAHLNLGNLLQKQGRNTDAEEAFRAALALRPDYGKAWNGLGQVLQHQGRLQDALGAFRNAAQCEPASAVVHCNLGTLLFAFECNAEALAELRRALALDPGYALAHGNLSALLARSGCPIAAESASRTAISLAPDQYCWLTNLGVALFSQGRHAEAEECYRKALAMQSGLCLRPRQSAVCAQLPHRRHSRSDLCRIPGLGPPPREAPRHPKRRHSRWIERQDGDCGSVTYRRTSDSMPWRCSPNRCWPRTIARMSNFISTRASRPRTPPPNGSVRSAITGAARSACATRSWPN